MRSCWILIVLAASLPGCTMVPVTEWNTLQAQNRALAEQNRAQLAQLDNLRDHCRTVEDRMLADEKQLAALQERAGRDRPAFESCRREQDDSDPPSRR
ncbi:MAG: hypothetical protein ABFC63_05775 [Thermoguttaceae bacterium]